jgi:competence ComEA-like helix-hairpin-helix protein
MHPVIVLLLAASTSLTTLPPGKGKPIVQRACVGCHALKVVTSKRATQEQWSALVDQMVTRGADLNDDEIEVVIAYLSNNFGPSSSNGSAPGHPRTNVHVNVNQATAAQLIAVLGLSSKDAQALVLYRKQNGKFKTLADLTRMPDIDTTKIESGKDKIQF